MSEFAPHQAIAKVSYTHDAMIDVLIANPAISQNDLAAHFGYTPAWVSQIIAADTFQARLAERRDEIIDPTLKATIKETFDAVIVRSIALLKEKLDKPDPPDNLVLRSLEIAARARGYGINGSTVAVQVNMGDHLEKLGENLTRLLERKKAEFQPSIDLGEDL